MGSIGRSSVPPHDSQRYYKQGDHDGLCGLYAALNSLRHLQVAADHKFLIDDDWAFFDEAIECLARVPGIGIRVLKNDCHAGGIDQYQIRDLCILLAERMNFEICVTLIGSGQSMSFARRYRRLLSNGQSFAWIAGHRDGSHWAVVTSGGHDAYYLIDEGISRRVHLAEDEKRKFSNDTAVLLTSLH